MPSVIVLVLPVQATICVRKRSDLFIDSWWPKDLFRSGLVKVLPSTE